MQLYISGIIGMVDTRLLRRARFKFGLAFCSFMLILIFGVKCLIVWSIALDDIYWLFVFTMTIQIAAILGEDSPMAPLAIFVGKKVEMIFIGKDFSKYD